MVTATGGFCIIIVLNPDIKLSSWLFTGFDLNFKFIYSYILANIDQYKFKFRRRDPDAKSLLMCRNSMNVRRNGFS